MSWIDKYEIGEEILLADDHPMAGQMAVIFCKPVFRNYRRDTLAARIGTTGIEVGITKESQAEKCNGANSRQSPIGNKNIDFY